MADWKQQIVEHTPFLIAATRGGGEMVNKLNLTRVLESLIIAGITGGIVMYGVQQKLDAQMSEIKAQMVEVKARLSEDRTESIVRDRRIEDRVDSIHSRPR